MHKNTIIKTGKNSNFVQFRSGVPDFCKKLYYKTAIKKDAVSNSIPFLTSYHSPLIIGVARYSTVLSLSASYRMATCILIFLFSTVIYSESRLE